jgi:hypothetical protein
MEKNASTHPRRKTLFTCGLFMAVALVAGICAGVPSFFVGALYGHLAEDVSSGDYDISRVERVIEEQPDRFGSLHINRGPAGKFLVEGPVETQADADLLREELIRIFGEERTNQVLSVTVGDETG